MRRKISQLPIVIAIFSLSVSLACYGQAAGQTSYTAKCLMCHGTTGLGDTPPGKMMNVQPFNSTQVLNMSDQALIGVLMNGSGKMPAYRGKISDTETNNLILFIHQLQKNQ